MLTLILGIGEALASAGIWIVSGIYKVAAFAFEIFLVLADGSLLTSINYKDIIENFYLVIGIIMLFIIAFSMLKGMVNPDDQKQGTSNVKKIIVNLITSAIMMAILSTVFTFAFDFQKSFINDSNPIGKFFGYGSLDNGISESNGIDSVKIGAYQLTNGVFTAFLNVNLDECPESEDGKVDISACQSQILDNSENKYFSGVMNEVENTGNFGLYTKFAGAVNDGTMEFNFLLSLIGGLILIYVAVSFCFDMAIRLVKLVLYQMIAPIPIFFRIIPEGKLNGTFNQWIKVTLTCYLEVYVRIFVFYFSVYLCKEIIASEFFSNLTAEGFWLSLFSKAFVLMGIITFMKQAPKLIAEVTGLDSGNMKLGIREKLAAGGAFTVGAVAGGALTAGARNLTNAGANIRNKYSENRNAGKGKITSAFGSLGTAARGVGSVVAGTLSGGARSGKAGWGAKSGADMKNAASKGAVGATDARNKRANYKAAHGGTTGGAIIGHIRDFGVSAGNYITDNSIEGLTRESQSMSKIVSKYNAFNDTIENLLEKEQSKGGGSVFAIDEKTGLNKEGFVLDHYKKFDFMAGQQKAARAAFNGGYSIDYSYYDDKGNLVTNTGKIDDDILRKIEGSYISSRDNARDELMNMALKGSKDKAYKDLSAKGQATLKDSLVNAESLQAAILENANTPVIRQIMGSTSEGGTGGLEKIINADPSKPLEVKDFKNAAGTKLKDAAKVAQGRADIKIAEMNKEQAAKGDKK